MRWFAITYCLIGSQLLAAQSKLTGVSTDLKCINEQYFIQQNINVNLEDTVSYLDLKALIFEGSDIKDIEVFVGTNYDSDDKVIHPVHFNNLNSKGLTHLRIILKESNAETISIHYTVKVDKSTFYLPLFFTDFVAASSDNDFFKMSISYAQKEYYQIHYPTVQLTELIENGKIVAQFELPALTSMIRMEQLAYADKPFNFVDLVDWGVALLFILIGFLIWHNRKRLIYG